MSTKKKTEKTEETEIKVVKVEKQTGTKATRVKSSIKAGAPWDTESKGKIH
jgi:hypothetical protein